MSYVLWSNYTQGREPLNWDLCQELFDTRGFKLKRDRKPTDKTNYLSYKCIASHTYVAYDSKRNCWTVFIKYWSGNRWRKIAEIYLNSRWRIFSDSDEVYSTSIAGRTLPDVESVMALPDSAFTSTYMSGLAIHRLNQMLPIHLYNKKNVTFINNKHLKYKPGISVDMQTNLLYPKWWVVAPRSWTHSRNAQELNDMQEWAKNLNTSLRSYVNKFVSYTYQKPSSHGKDKKYILKMKGLTAEGIRDPEQNESAWIDNLSNTNKSKVVADGHYRTIVDSNYISSKSEIKLYQLIFRAQRIGHSDEDEVAGRVRVNDTRERRDIIKCFPVYLLYKAFKSETMLDETYIGKFFIVATVWSFSFQVLCEIRHLFWDLGYGFEIKTSNVTGLLVIFGSVFLTILILGKNIIL